MESTLLRKIRLPERHYQAAGDYERSAERNRHVWERSEDDHVNHLPNDKQSSDIEPNHLPELQRGKIQRNSISQEEDRADQPKRYPGQPDVLINRDSYKGIAGDFKSGRDH